MRNKRCLKSCVNWEINVVGNKRGFDMKKRRYLFESDQRLSKEERNNFLESLKKFTEYKKELFRETGIVNEKTGKPVSFSQRLNEINNELASMIEQVEHFTLQETQDNFDKISVNRDLKEIKTDYQMFSKTCNEMRSLQQRLEACYENIGMKLGRYYEI